MTVKNLSIVLITYVLITSCSNFSEAPISDLGEGGVKAQISLEGIGTIGKNRAITLKKLYVVLTAFGCDTLRDSLDLVGSGTQTITTTFNDLASNKTSTLYAYSIDSNGKIIHRGSTVFMVEPGQTIMVTMDLKSEYSMLFANFFPIKDSVNRCELQIDYVQVADTSFQKQSLLGDTVTQTYDYVTASPVGIMHTIIMNVYGNINGTDTMMYSGDTTILISSGSNTQYSMLLKWVGPFIPDPGNLTMTVVLGVGDTISINGEINDTNFVKKSPIAWMGKSEGGGTGTYDIFYWNGNSIKQLTNDSYNENIVKISGTSILWISGDWFDNKLHYWDEKLSDTVETIDKFNRSLSADLSGNNVILTKQTNGNTNDVYLWNAVTKTTIQITATPNISEQKPVISGNTGAWYKYRNSHYEISLWDGSSIQQVADNLTEMRNLNIFGDYVTWSEKQNPGYIENVFLWNRVNKSIAQISANTTPFQINSTKISGKNIVWSGGPRGSSNSLEIYTWQNGTINRLTNNSQADINPSISGSEIVWQRYDGTDYEIFYWNGSSVIQLTNNSEDDILPQIQGKLIFWQGFDGQDYEIYYYDKYTSYQITDNNYDDVFQMQY